LCEVVVPFADGAKGLRRFGADDLVGDITKCVAHHGCGHGNGDDDPLWRFHAKRADGSSHRGAGGESVVDENHGLAEEVGPRTIVAIKTFASLQLSAFIRSDVIELCVGHVSDAHEVAIEDFHAAARDGAHGQLFMIGQAEFANDEHVEGDAECSGDFEAYGNAAAGKGEDDDVGALRVNAELGGEATSGIVAVAEFGAHVVFAITEGA
jgi:hypothetical protein